MLYDRDSLKKCSRKEYADYTRTLSNDQSRVVEGNTISVTQWVNPDNLVIAQAIYQNGSAYGEPTISAEYQVKR
jgi:hypothetical protein